VSSIESLCPSHPVCTCRGVGALIKIRRGELGIGDISGTEAGIRKGTAESFRLIPCTSTVSFLDVKEPLFRTDDAECKNSSQEAND